MKILVYIEKGTDAGKRLEKAIEMMSSNTEMTIVNTITAIKRELRVPRIPPKPAVIVLLAEDIRRLNDLFAMRVLFQDIRIILILPDDKEETLAIGYQLYPRYLSYTHSDFSDVKMVMEKMISKDTLKPEGVKF
ncbi:MAG: hypothetical protein PVG39_08220 [Desulfobacteraceae bacterium]